MRLLLTTAIITSFAIPAYAGSSLRDRAGSVSYASPQFQPQPQPQSVASVSGYSPEGGNKTVNPTIYKDIPLSEAKSSSSQGYRDIPRSNAMNELSNEVGQSTLSKSDLQPRAEINHRYSNDRAITMSEFWVPLAQNTEDGSVLFGDVRFMGDNNDNKEFNIGAGYRNIVDSALLGEGIIGGMVWFDRRATASNSKFNQVTVGGEWLGKSWDVRANGYIPLNEKETFTRANPNGPGAGFSNNQLLVNTDQVVVEEALKGGDIEIGYRLPFMDGLTDATRVYAGGYHFTGDRAEDVSGWRARFTSDLTRDIQVGARYQDDDVRGSQTYLEATVRFPFSAKKSFQEDGLRSRLDESPERDIDIVSNEAVIDPGLINTTLLNAVTGAAQNIIHVDNTNGAGTGTAADPFNTLAAAEAAAGVNDMIYVHRGDGTTTGQANGITLNDAGQMLTGSGADLMFSTDRFRTANGLGISQPIIKKTAVPVITNGAGNGIEVTADDVFVSGVAIDGASSNGVLVLNADNIVIDTVISSNNADKGITTNIVGSSVNQVVYTNNITTGNQNAGMDINLYNGSSLQQAIYTSNTAIRNGGNGLRIFSRESNVALAIFENNIAINNINNNGFFANVANAGNIERISFINNTAIGNSGIGGGFRALAETNGNIGQLIYQGNTSANNLRHGIAIEDNSVAGGIIADLGGGSLGSKGGNRVFGNNLEGLYVDLDGAALDANGNWWGTPVGLSNDEVTLIDGSRINASNPLRSDPN